jgi:amidase
MDNKQFRSYKELAQGIAYKKSQSNCYVELSELSKRMHTKLHMPPKPPLDEMTFSVKDCFDYPDRTPTFGIQQWKNTHPKPQNKALLISRLENAGGHLDGFTKCDQLAYSLVGNVFSASSDLESDLTQPINPLYLDRFCGGSSSGSAASVAERVVDFSIGVDTAGSVRVPASSCGTYGLRSTHGLINTDGCIPLAQTFDTIGLFTNSTALLQAVLEVVSAARVPNVNHIKKILIPEDSYALLDEDLASTCTDFADGLSNHWKIPMEEVSMGHLTSQEVADLFTRIQSRQIWENHGTWIEENSGALNSEVHDRLLKVKKLYDDSSKEDIKNDKMHRLKIRGELLKLLDFEYIVALPAIPQLAPKITATEEELNEFRQKSLRLNALSSLAGTPQIVAPCVSNETGNIYGGSFIGAPYDDGKLIKFLSV